MNLEFDFGSFFYHDNDETMGSNYTLNHQNLSDPYLWRHDPDESMSDWTIVITTKSTTIYGDDDNVTHKKKDISDLVKIYHIHKYVVGGGPRGSEYFLQLFRANQAEKSKTSSTSHIELETSAAIAFPLMLDFMYAIHSTDVEASTDTAVALRYLANYFGVPTLFDSVNKFIQKDMNKYNSYVYLKEATLYKDEKIMEGVMMVGTHTWNSRLPSTQECSLTYMELLPLPNFFQFTNLVVWETDQLLQKTKRDDDQLLQKTRGGDAAQLLTKKTQELNTALEKLQRFRPDTSTPADIPPKSERRVIAGRDIYGQNISPFFNSNICYNVGKRWTAMDASTKGEGILSFIFRKIELISSWGVLGFHVSSRLE